MEFATIRKRATCTRTLYTTSVLSRLSEDVPVGVLHFVGWTFSTGTDTHVTTTALILGNVYCQQLTLLAIYNEAFKRN